MGLGYRDDESEGQNLARAVFEVAEALRDLHGAIKYSRREGLSLAEAVEVSARTLGEAVTSGCADVCEAIQNHQEGT